MPPPFVFPNTISEPPVEYLRRVGQVFATFDASTQDSGNVSYGVQIDADRYFVKTAGLPDIKAHFDHLARVALLDNAVEIANSCTHSALVKLIDTIDGSSYGPLLVYEWIDGEHMVTSRAQRNNPESIYQRFSLIPLSEKIAALDAVFDCHYSLAKAGWIACDFYDGSLIYDLDKKSMRVMDIDMYHHGEFTNTVGEMPGSSRFMAPEEKTLGAAIDQRTNVYTFGRTMAEFISDGSLERAPFLGDEYLFSVMQRACQLVPDARFATVAQFYSAWRDAIG